jgi:PAS domain S-box-containing protein
MKSAESSNRRLPPIVYRLLLSVITLIVIAATGGGTRYLADRELRGNLLQQARKVVQQIDSEAVKALTGDNSDQAHAASQNIESLFISARTANSKCASIYLMGRQADRTIHFLADSGIPVSADNGEGHLVVNRSAEFVFASKSSLITEPTSGRWGKWFSVLVPVIDPKTGDVLAVLGMDFNTNTWNWDVAAMAGPTTIVVLVILLGAAVVLHLMRRRQLKEDPNTPKPISLRLLPPLAAMVTLLMGGSGALLYQQHRKRLAEEVASDTADIFGYLRQSLNQQAANLTTAIQPIAKNPSVIEALRSADSSRLQQDWAQVFEYLRKDSRITHFNFYDVNRVCVMRMDDPERRGDMVGRQTTIAAERSRKTACGIELGTLGILALWVVEPVFDGQNLVGYVEFGNDIQAALQALHSKSNCEVAVILHKHYLDRSKWEKGMRLLGHEANWDQLTRSVVIHSSKGRLPDPFVRWVETSIDRVDSIDDHEEIIHNGQQWRITTSPLEDFTGKKLGDVLIMRDVSINNASFARLMTLGGLAGAVLLAQLLGFMYALLRDTDVGIRFQQAELRESESKHRLLFENAGDAIFIHDAEGRILEVNTTACDRMGYRRDELLSMIVEQVMAPEEVINLPASISSLQGTDSILHECLLMRRDGSLIPTELNIRLIIWDGEQVVMSVCRDITKRREAQIELQASEERYRAILNASPDNLTITDLEGRIQMVSPAALPMFECKDQEELVGRSAFDFIAPQDREDASSRAALMLQGVKHGPIEYRGLRADGHVIDIEVNSECILDLERKPASIVYIIRDITERKQSQIYRDMGGDILQILNEDQALKESVSQVIAAIKTKAGFDAVGIRMQDGMELPDFGRKGFSVDMLITEFELHDHSENQKSCSDGCGNVCLDCTRQMVLAGKHTSKDSFFTRDGSFWTNNFSALLEIELPPNEDGLKQARSQCMYHGYASVAFIPIHTKDKIVGLLQLYDRRRGLFSNTTIEQLEGIAAHLGEAIMRKKAEEQVRELLEESNHARLALLGIIEDEIRAGEALASSQMELKAVYDNAPVIMCVVDEHLNVLFANPIFAAFTGSQEDSISGRHVCAVFGCGGYTPSSGSCLAADCHSCSLRHALDDTLRTGNSHQGIEHAASWGQEENRRSAFLLGSISPLNSGGHKRVLLCLHDITERKRLEVYRSMGSEIIQILHEPEPLKVLARRVLDVLKLRTGLDAISIRLQSIEGSPYFLQDGFSPEFLLNPGSLEGEAENGMVCCDFQSTSFMECPCGLVVSDCSELSYRPKTRGGSQWTSDASRLLDTDTTSDPGLKQHGHCVRHGYASIALIPILNQDHIVGLIQLNDRRKGCFTEETIELLEQIAAHFGETLMRRHAEDVLHQTAADLHILAGRLQAVREEERATLSRELHDYLGQHLTALQMDLMWIDRHLQTADAPDRAVLYDRIVAMVPAVDRLIEHTQTFCAELRPAVLYDLGLVDAIEWQVEETSKRTGLDCTMVPPDEEIELAQDISLALYRIVQESLTNVVRHAQATQVVVSIRILHSELELRIQDDGRGFAPNSISGPKALGVIGIRERAGTFGGTVEFFNEMSKGACVLVRVPYTSHQLNFAEIS